MAQPAWWYGVTNATHSFRLRHIYYVFLVTLRGDGSGVHGEPQVEVPEVDVAGEGLERQEDPAIGRVLVEL